MNQYTFLHDHGNMTLTLGATDEREALALLASVVHHPEFWTIDSIITLDEETP